EDGRERDDRGVRADITESDRRLTRVGADEIRAGADPQAGPWRSGKNDGCSGRPAHRDTNPFKRRSNRSPGGRQVPDVRSPLHPGQAMPDTPRAQATPDSTRLLQAAREARDDAAPAALVAAGALVLLALVGRHADWKLLGHQLWWIWIVVALPYVLL